MTLRNLKHESETIFENSINFETCFIGMKMCLKRTVFQISFMKIRVLQKRALKNGPETRPGMILRHSLESSFLWFLNLQ